MRPYKRPRTYPSVVKLPSYRRYRFTPRTFGNALSYTERKYFDHALAGTALVAVGGSWAGTEFDGAAGTLFFPRLGNDISNRVGRKVQVLSIKINGVIGVVAQANQINTDNAVGCRLILYMDKQTNGLQSQGEQVIDSGGTSVAYCMHQNTASFGRFKILRDRVINVQNPAISWDGTNMEQQGLCKFFKLKYKFRKPVTVHFNEVDGGSVADIIDNSFHVIANCRSVGLAPTIEYKCRVCFVDV